MTAAHTNVNKTNWIHFNTIIVSSKQRTGTRYRLTLNDLPLSLWFNVDGLFFFLSRSGTVRFLISHGSYAAIALGIPAVKRNDRSRIVANVFDSARTPDSFFVDCFSFEANCFWKHQCVFGQLCIQLVRSKQVCDQQSVVYCPSVIQVLIAHVSTQTWILNELHTLSVLKS